MKVDKIFMNTKFTRAQEKEVFVSQLVRV